MSKNANGRTSENRTYYAYQMRDTREVLPSTVRAKRGEADSALSKTYLYGRQARPVRVRLEVIEILEEDSEGNQPLDWR